jgi:hypothetical protein
MPRHAYLFSINPNTPPVMKGQPGEEFRIEVLSPLAEFEDVATWRCRSRRSARAIL